MPLIREGLYDLKCDKCYSILKFEQVDIAPNIIYVIPCSKCLEKELQKGCNLTREVNEEIGKDEQEGSN